MDFLDGLDVQSRNWSFLNNQIQYMERALTNLMNDPRLDQNDREFVVQRYATIIAALQNERQRRINEFHHFQVVLRHGNVRLPRNAIVEIGRAIYNGVRLPNHFVNEIIDLTGDDEDE